MWWGPGLGRDTSKALHTTQPGKRPSDHQSVWHKCILNVNRPSRAAYVEGEVEEHGCAGHPRPLQGLPGKLPGAPGLPRAQRGGEGEHRVGPTPVMSEDPGAGVPAGTSALSFLGARARSEPGTMPGSPSLGSDPPHSHGVGMSFPHDRERI